MVRSAGQAFPTLTCSHCSNFQPFRPAETRHTVRCTQFVHGQAQERDERQQLSDTAQTGHALLHRHVARALPCLLQRAWREAACYHLQLALLMGQRVLVGEQGAVGLLQREHRGAPQTGQDQTPRSLSLLTCAASWQQAVVAAPSAVGQGQGELQVQACAWAGEYPSCPPVPALVGVAV